MMVAMKTVSALEMRQHFGELLDEAAAGEHIVIERAGQPRAVVIPLDDYREIDPDAQLARKKEALEDIKRMARLRPFPKDLDSAAMIRKMRDDRTEQIARAIFESREERR
jgi:prevent-host-death family protein